MQKTFLSFACVMGAMAVILGAFGAHALKTRLSPGDLQVFETGVKYQMYHAFALISIGLLMEKCPLQSTLHIAGYCFMAGIILFSGSLYLLASKILFGIEGWRWLGPVTPLGGLFLIAGWIFLLISVSACSAQKKVPQQLQQSESQASFRLIVSFISTGAGTDSKAYALFEKHLGQLDADKKETFKYEAIPWGREGELDCCFKLTKLTPMQQQEFIDQLKLLLKSHPLVQFKEHAIETRKVKVH